MCLVEQRRNDAWPIVVASLCQAQNTMNTWQPTDERLSDILQLLGEGLNPVRNGYVQQVNFFFPYLSIRANS